MSDEQDRKDVECLEPYLVRKHEGQIAMRWAYWPDRVKIVFPMDVGSLEFTAAEARMFATALLDLAAKADPDHTGKPSPSGPRLVETA